MPNRRIEEVMSGLPLVHLPPTATVREAAQEMSSKHIAAIAVMAGGEGADIEGIFTERDLIDRVVAPGLDPDAVRLADVMTRHPVSVGVDRTVRQALAEMRDNNLRHLPVSKDGKIVGMVSMRDFVGTEIAELDFEREYIKSLWEHMR